MVSSITLSGVAGDLDGRFTTPAVMKLNQSLAKYASLLLPNASNPLAQREDTRHTHTQGLSFSLGMKTASNVNLTL